MVDSKKVMTVVCVVWFDNIFKYKSCITKSESSVMYYMYTSSGSVWIRNKVLEIGKKLESIFKKKFLQEFSNHTRVIKPVNKGKYTIILYSENV